MACIYADTRVVIDTLPLELSIQLRANRAGLSLLDSHGQIWTELSILAAQDRHWYRDPHRNGRSQTKTRKNGTKGVAKEMEAQLVQKLGFNGQTAFPVRRLGILWRNERWRKMISEWCQYPLGQSTFNISTWEGMSSCRIDDVSLSLSLSLSLSYVSPKDSFSLNVQLRKPDLTLTMRTQFWFTTFQTAIDTLHIFREQHHLEVQPSDWIRLTQLPRSRKGKDVQDLFFPGLGHEDEDDVSRLRARDFFADLDDAGYDRAYDVVLENPTLQFPDVHAFLKSSKSHGKVMKTVMTHVGQWLNRDAFRVADRAGEKPPLWKDLLPAVERRHPDDAASQCLELQRHVLTFVQERLADLTQIALEPFLEAYPDHVGHTYIERFTHNVWRDLLVLVYDFCGPSFQHDALVHFNREAPTSISSHFTSTIARDLCQRLDIIPEIAQNPALQTQAAAQDLALHIQPIVLQWAIRQCLRFFVTKPGEGIRDDEALLTVHARLRQYRQLTGDLPAV